MSPPPKAPRMAIKFSTTTTTKTKSSNGLPHKSKPPSTLGKRARPSALGGDSGDSSDSSDSDSDEDERTRRKGKQQQDGRAEAVSELGGLPDRKVIKLSHASAKLPKKKKSRDTSPSQTNKETEPADEDKSVQWGLQLTKKQPPTTLSSRTSNSDTKDGKKTAPEKTADQEAMDRLLGNDTEEKKVIAQQHQEESEIDAYKRDFRLAPDADDINVDTGMDPTEFGKAMLRGMGWRDEEEEDKKDGGVKKVERRQNLLGLGAKALKEDEELGAWEHGGKKKKGNRPPKLSEYNNEKRREKERRERHRDGERDRDRDRRRHDRR